jgi:hypothetical protein
MVVERAGIVVLVMGLAAGCGKPLTGAALMPSSQIPRGELIASYSHTACIDGSDRASRRIVDHLRGANGYPLLVERGASPEWLVVSNSFRDGSFIVFQAIQETMSPKMVWEYRVPADGSASGTFRTSINAVLQTLPDGSFKAVLGGELNRCVLQRVDSTTGLPTDPGAQVAVRGATPSIGTNAIARPDGSPTGSSRVPHASSTTPLGAIAPLAAGANEPKSWGYDGRSFKVGDRLLVDIGNRSVVATVVQAMGEQYYVHYEGAVSGTGEWIRPWRVTGRLRP